MDLFEAIKIKINNLMIERNLTASKLSTLAGISRSTLSKFMSGKRKSLDLKTIEFICEGLNIKLRDFFNDSLFDNIDIKD